MAEIAIMDRRKWLKRLIYVRLVVFSVFVAGRAFIQAEPSLDLFVLLGAVYALSVCWFALLRLNRSYVWQSYAQIAVDLLLITWGVNRTGGPDSYFSSLYFLEIVMSSILLERRGAFVAGTASSIIHFAHMTLAYFEVVRIAPPHPLGDLVPLQYSISLSIFGFCSVAFLSNFLVFMPAILLSGFVFPVSSMPAVFQWITLLNPVRHYLVIVRGLFLKGVGLPALWPEFVWLLVLGVALLGFASTRFRKTVA